MAFPANWRAFRANWRAFRANWRAFPANWRAFPANCFSAKVTKVVKKHEKMKISKKYEK